MGLLSHLKIRDGGAAGLVLSAASNLSKHAEQLSGEVNVFLAGVRAA